MSTQMKYRLSKYLLFLMVVLFSTQSRAQQDPMFTHYMYNMSVLNPAYATETPDVLNIGGLYRSQWVGVRGAPTSATFFAHKPISKRVELGVSVVNDQIGGVVNENNVYFDFAYVLPLSDETRISLGVKAGATFFETNFNGFVLSDPLPDATFQNNISKVFPNVGTGIYFFGKNYYAGLSVPNLLMTKHLERTDGITTTGVEQMHYFLTGGYVFTFNNNDNFKLKPAFMARAVSGAPLSLDITANMLFNNKFEFGVGYRNGDSVSGLTSFYVTPSLRVGYSYDYTLTNLRNFNSGSHEVFLLFDLDFSKLSDKGYDKSPRFF